MVNAQRGPKNEKRKKLLILINRYSTALPGKQADILTVVF